MESPSIPLLERDTYIYIDVSNIRLACQKTLGLRLNFVRLLQYFQKKYPNLKDVRYYEGIEKGDSKKYKMFDFLSKKGYTICSLERKSYVSTEVEERAVECPKCKHEWTEELTKEHKVMKSNVDVYLASDMLVQASLARCPIRLILVSCDGDYAEAIKNMIHLNENVNETALATPPAKDQKKNTVSIRLKQLYREMPLHRYDLANIDTIRAYIS